MWPRLSIVAGFLAGVAAAALVIGGILAFAPEPGVAATPPPQPSASLAVVPSLTPSPAPSASASASPSTSASASPSGGASAAHFHVGEAAPALVVPQVGGGTIDLANLRGKPVWVNFMGSYSAPSLDEFPLMNGYATRLAGKGLVVIAIDVKENERVATAFAELTGATFPLGLDTDGSVAARWDAVTLPVHFWVDRDGIIRDGALGGIGPDVMSAGLRRIMPGVEVGA